MSDLDRSRNIVLYNVNTMSGSSVSVFVHVCICDSFVGYCSVDDTQLVLTLTGYRILVCYRYVVLLWWYGFS